MRKRAKNILKFPKDGCITGILILKVVRVVLETNTVVAITEHCFKDMKDGVGLLVHWGGVGPTVRLNRKEDHNERETFS